MYNKFNDLAKRSPINRGLCVCFEEEVGFSLAIIEKNKISYACRVIFGSSKIEDQLKESMSFFETKKELLNGAFDNVVVCFSNMKYILVPSYFYNFEEEEELLHFNTYLLTGDTIKRNYINNYQSYLIFSYQEKFEEFIKKKYNNITTLHSLGAFLSSKEAHVDKTVIYVMFYFKQFELILLEGEKLILSNTFEYTGKKDVLYYILLIIERLGYKDKDFDVFLEGKIDIKDELYLFLARYIKNIKIINCKFGIKSNFSKEFNFLFNLFQCALYQEN